MNKWISIKDRLPVWGAKCLVAYKNDVVHDYEVAEITYGDPFRDGFGIRGVTHWMPLPEPPDELETK